MKVSFLISFLLLSTLLLEAQGINRKLMTKTTSTSSPISKNHMNEGNKADPKLKGEGLSGKQESFLVKSSPVSEHREATTPESYPDVLDIAGMDYSPARRKSPIHN